MSTVTLALWINISALATDRQILYTEPVAGAPTTARFMLWIDTDKKLLFGGRAPDGDAFNTWVDSAQSLSENTWHHVEVAFDADNDKQYLFLDGGMEQSADAEPAFTDANPNVNATIAYHRSTTSFSVDGLIDEVCLASSILHTANFTRPTVEYSAGTCDLGLWHMNEGTGQVAADSSGNGHDGQLGSTGGVDADDPTWIGAEEAAGHEGLDWDSPESPLNELTNFTITLSNRTTGAGFPGEPWWFLIGGVGSDDAWWNIYDENDLRWLYGSNQTYTASYDHIGLDSGLHTLYGYSNDTAGTVFTDTLALTVRDYDPIAYAALSLGVIGFVAIFGFIYRKRR